MKTLFKRTHALLALAIVLAPTLIYGQTTPAAPSPTPSLRTGTLDASFGTGGTLTTDFAGATDQALSVVVQPDGKIVAAGTTFVSGSFDFASARYE